MLTTHNILIGNIMITMNNIYRDGKDYLILISSRNLKNAIVLKYSEENL